MRDLEHVVHQAMLWTEGPIITKDVILTLLLSDTERMGQVAEPAASELAPETIRRTLDLASWNKRETARRMGISRATLYRLLARHGIRR